MIDPRPFYDKDNDLPGSGGIVIHRYWPMSIDETAGEIESMMVAIEKSPSITPVEYPLNTLHDDTPWVISHNPPLEACEQRKVIDREDRRTLSKFGVIASGRRESDFPLEPLD